MWHHLLESFLYQYNFDTCSSWCYWGTVQLFEFLHFTIVFNLESNYENKISKFIPVKTHFAQTCLSNVLPYLFWFPADQCPDLASRLHIQTRVGIMDHFTLVFELSWPTQVSPIFTDLCRWYFLFPFWLSQLERNSWLYFVEKVTMELANSNATDVIHI